MFFCLKCAKLLVVVGCSGLHYAVLGCTGYIYQAVVSSGFDHWDAVNSYFSVYSAIFGMVTNEQTNDNQVILVQACS